MSAGCFSALAQNTEKPVKVSHAEPIFQDLVRDLGARKGEKEFNIGTDFSNTKNYQVNGYLAEYEFAPVNRLGLEVETDFSFYYPRNNSRRENIPGNKLDEIKLSAQYTFLVSKKSQTSLAVGYTQVFNFTDFKNYDKEKLITGLVYSPFFVAAKKWGKNIHTLIYMYPMIQQTIGVNGTPVDWQINTSVMYSLPNSSNFIGIEVNKEISHGKIYTILHPQIKIKLNSNTALGFATGIPIHNDKENTSAFFRLIYEL